MYRSIRLTAPIIWLLLAACNLGVAAPSAEPDQPAGSVGLPPLTSITTSSGDKIDLVGPTVGSTMVWVDSSILVYVPGGDFVMGAAGLDNPQHTIIQSPFWIYRSEVSNSQYSFCIAAKQCTAPQDSEAAGKLAESSLRDRPVVGVVWEQADTYCKWVQGHLPTEAQWEKTARGPEANIYPWGDEIPTCDLLNFNNCIGATTSITQYPAGKSFYEALDLSGNVFEWVQDWYDQNYYQTSPPVDPRGPSDGEERVVRSSSYLSTLEDALLANRYSFIPTQNRVDLGFRCVVDNPSYFPPFCQASPIYTSNSIPGDGVDIQTTTSCEPPNVSVGGSYCSSEQPTANIFTEGEVSAVQGNDVICSLAQDGLYTCAGDQGATAQVEICGECQAPIQQDDDLADPMAPGPNQECPSVGYAYNPDSGACEWIPLSEEPYLGCPPGYFEEHPDRNNCEDVPLENYCPVEREYDPIVDRCIVPPQAANGQGVCPNPGYTYDEATQMCQWQLRNRPAGLCIDPATGVQWVSEECEPGGAIGNFTYFCPLGSAPDATGQFCVQPLDQAGNVANECANGICDAADRDFACPVGTYFDEGIQLCAPASGNPMINSCIPGFAFDPSLGCCQSTTTTTYPGCAPGELADPVIGCIKPPTFNNSSGTSCITVNIDLPKCPPVEEDKPGDDGDGEDGGGTTNTCAQYNGDYAGCTAAGCSYDTLTNTCN